MSSGSAGSGSSADGADLTAERDALERAEVTAMALADLRRQRAVVTTPADPETFARFERALGKLTADVLRASKELQVAIDDDAAETQLQRVGALLALEDSTDMALVAYVAARAALAPVPTEPDAENELQTMLRAEQIRAAARSAQDRRDADS